VNISPTKNHDKAAQLHMTDTNRKYDTAPHNMILKNICKTNTITTRCSERRLIGH
jgi:hypothetical protein